MSDYDGFVASWLDNLLDSIEERAGKEVKARILEDCARMCTAHWAAKAAEVREAAPDKEDVDALLAAFVKVLPGGDTELAREGDTITWRFTGAVCPCPVEKYVEDPEFCHCSQTHVRGMLEPLLGRSVSVELERARHRGDPDCFFVIHLEPATG
jgi:predicted ArsR family transcriptional regulator